MIRSKLPYTMTSRVPQLFVEENVKILKGSILFSDGNTSAPYSFFNKAKVVTSLNSLGAFKLRNTPGVSLIYRLWNNIGVRKV